MAELERVEVNEAEEIFENDIEMFLKVFCEENKIEDFTKEPQSRWNACLMFINNNVFKGTNKLKNNKNIIKSGTIMASTFNCYDYDKVDKVLNIYYYLCSMYDKECSYMGFSLLTGINIDTLIDWAHGNNKLSTKSFEISQKLLKFREESLSNKLATGAKNPVGILAILNRHFAWNMPGVSREQTNNRPRLSAEDIKQQLLNGPDSVRMPELSDNRAPDAVEMPPGNDTQFNTI